MQGANVLRASIAAALLAAACGAPDGSARSASQDLEADAAAGLDAGGAADAGDAPDGAGLDGTPVRRPCTSSFGDGLSGSFGRLDGFVVAVVPPGHGACNADGHHVHVQVLAGGQTYDVAINTDAGFMTDRTTPLPWTPWAEGWHRGGSLDYASDLGLHVADFASGSEATLDQDLETALASANHVSVFATLYDRGGVHLVHRRGHGQDGALVLDPLSPSAHLYAFRFVEQVF